MHRCISLLLIAAIGFAFTACRTRTSQTVVVYVSEDQVFSEPILKDFERDTSIAEKDNPQADVYWANEPVRAGILKQRGVSAPYQSPACVITLRSYSPEL